MQHDQDEEAGLSSRLARLDTGQDTTIGAVVDSLGATAFGATMFVFAVPNLVPNPPGTSPFLGAPLIFLSLQLLLGRRELWLPAWLRGKPLSQQFLASFTRRIAPAVTRIERLLRPRAGMLVDGSLATRFIGLAAMPLALLLLLPLPFLHMLPGAAMTCLAAGLATRDGKAVLLGHILTVTTLLAMAALVMLGHTGVTALWNDIASGRCLSFGCQTE